MEILAYEHIAEEGDFSPTFELRRTGGRDSDCDIMIRCHFSKIEGMKGFVERGLRKNRLIEGMSEGSVSTPRKGM